MGVKLGLVTLKLSARALVALAVSAALLGAPGVSSGAASDTYRAGVARLVAEAGKAPERARLNRLFQLHWDYLMEEFPEFATEVGVAGHNGRWTDQSAAAITRRKADLELPAKALATIDRTKLAAEDALNYDLFKRRLGAELDGRRFPWELLPLTQLYGIQQSVPQILSEQMPTRNTADYEAILSRLRATPALVDQTIASMKEGVRRGVTPPKITLGGVVGQAEAMLVEDPAKNPLLGAFQKMPEAIPGDRREALKADAVKALTMQALPAFRRLRDFLANDYIPNCRESLATSALPDGRDWYAYRVAHSTTTRLTAAQIHEIGLEEVKQIRAEMERLMRATGFAGDLPAFFDFLRTDPRFFYRHPEDLLAGYREIAKRADPEVIKLFGRMPRLPYGVVPMMHGATSRSAGAYDAGSLAVGRPGYFVANLSAVETRPKWEMEALVLHEAVPGHHLQIALAQELDLPKFRKYGGYVAFGEGWALYAETLGQEMGFYTDPYSRFGALNYQMWRAVRLVVDSGIHALGWSRQQAIDYFRANAAKPEREIAVEIDRYIVSPGQALAYKIGQRKFLELRERATKALGPRFDIRAFHDAVLAEGALPLDLLDTRIDAWIAQKKASASSGARGR